MGCTKCGVQAVAYEGLCYNCVLSIRNKTSPFVSDCPSWLANFSNKIMPPVFFMILAVLSFHFFVVADTTPLRINLGVVSVASSSMGLYFGSLLL